MKLTQRNYFSKKANQLYMGSSQFKSFEKCSHTAMAEINGLYVPETTPALLVGKYVDSYFEGTQEAFRSEHPEMFKRDGTLKAEYIKADEVIERVKRDKLWMAYATGKQQVIMTGNIAGVDVKIMIDSLHPDKIVDRKIMKDFENVYVSDKGSVPFFEAWGYDLQGAIYQEVVRQNTGLKLPFYLAAATKEKTPDIDIVHINQKTLDFALDHFANEAPMYDAIKNGIVEPERCEKCDYCKQTKSLTEPTDSDDYYLI